MEEKKLEKKEDGWRRRKIDEGGGEVVERQELSYSWTISFPVFSIYQIAFSFLLRPRFLHSSFLYIYLFLFVSLFTYNPALLLGNVRHLPRSSLYLFSFRALSIYIGLVS
jgi:hypothetical protein